MTLRQAPGGDARRIHALVDTLLDSEDSLIVLVDGRRAVSFAEGFGLSPCQLELVTVEVERAVRAVAGNTPLNSGSRRTNEHANEPRKKGGAHEHLGIAGGGPHGAVAHRGRARVEPAGGGSRDRRISSGPVFRLARKAAAPGSE